MLIPLVTSALKLLGLNGSPLISGLGKIALIGGAIATVTIGYYVMSNRQKNLQLQLLTKQAEITALQGDNAALKTEKARLQEDLRTAQRLESEREKQYIVSLERVQSLETKLERFSVRRKPNEGEFNLDMFNGAINRMLLEFQPFTFNNDKNR